MGVSVEVNGSNFESDVVQASFQRPVIVDFFAQWCGPCQMLKPLLEKLVQEYDFVLAKVDIDQNPELASTYGIEGVPDVRVVSQGQMQPGFVGALPEPKLRQFLAQLNLKSGLDMELETVQAAIRAGNLEVAKAGFTDLMEKYPQNRQLAIAAAKFLISQDRLDSAEKLLVFIDESDREYSGAARALRELMQLKLESIDPILNHELDPPFFRAVQQTLSENYEAALSGFLEIVGKSRKYRNDGARKAMVMIFDLMGDENPLTKVYRKQLTQALY
ncbi:MAG: tetratricopeptide repeat protein [Oscillatoriophycideae cyanobacterium NC_groundwater_1537_Pr4_S-0.65um_50_18]|nr:tetratricopeptide repeat protein [Oscillatoriophycideae cyanobacterium NC_groundwater_1537_Pr4_S-0.65um_50_18]